MLPRTTTMRRDETAPGRKRRFYCGWRWERRALAFLKAAWRAERVGRGRGGGDEDEIFSEEFKGA